MALILRKRPFSLLIRKENKRRATKRYRWNVFGRERMHMKIRRTLSELLFGLGCAVVFIGALAFILPGIENPQLKLFLASFESPSRFAVINAVNRFLVFTLAHGWQVLGVGALCLLLGMGLLLHFSDSGKPVETAEQPFQRPVREAVPTPSDQPNPFAVAEHTEPDDFASRFLAYHRPLLEENRIDENSPYLPSNFPGESAAILSERGDASPSGARTILRTPIEIKPEEPVSAPLPPLTPSVSAADAPVKSDQPASSRIRSTMGQHKQW